MLSKLLLVIAVTAAIVISYQFVPSSAPAPSIPAVSVSTPSSAPTLSFPVTTPLPINQPPRSSSPSLLTRLLSPFVTNPLGETPSNLAVSSPAPAAASPFTSPSPAPVDESTIFNKLWPDYYRASLADTRDFLVSRDYLSENSNYSLDTEASIWTFLNDYTTAYRNIASLSDSEYAELKNNLSAAPALKDAQRQEIIGDLSFSFQHLLTNLFSAPIARASWVSSAGGGLCYRDDAPGNLAVGPSSPAVSCNSGLWCSHGCSFRADCGPYAGSCNVQLGCLNQTCRGFANALYDPSTSMCGCG